MKTLPLAGFDDRVIDFISDGLWGKRQAIIGVKFDYLKLPKEPTITVGMIKFLDSREEKDLVLLAYELRNAWGLTEEQAAEMVKQWKNIQII